MPAEDFPPYILLFNSSIEGASWLVFADKETEETTDFDKESKSIGIPKAADFGERCGSGKKIFEVDDTSLKLGINDWVLGCFGGDFDCFPSTKSVNKLISKN